MVNQKNLTELEQDLLEASEAMLAHSRKQKQFSVHEYKVPDEVNVKEIRDSMHLTQKQFAHYIGASVHAIRHWENGRRKPDGTARVLLKVMEKYPDIVINTIQQL